VAFKQLPVINVLQAVNLTLIVSQGFIFKSSNYFAFSYSKPKNINLKLSKEKFQ
jgi:hypothetical protein